jgi:hypothetical protein
MVKGNYGTYENNDDGGDNEKGRDSIIKVIEMMIKMELILIILLLPVMFMIMELNTRLFDVD